MSALTKANKIIHGTNTSGSLIRFNSAWSYFIECSFSNDGNLVSEFDLKYLVLLEWIITVLFTIEYIFRIISINRPWKRL
jgi:voltage-gated potassium channel